MPELRRENVRFPLGLLSTRIVGAQIPAQMFSAACCNGIPSWLINYVILRMCDRSFSFFLFLNLYWSLHVLSIPLSLNLSLCHSILVVTKLDHYQCDTYFSIPPPVSANRKGGHTSRRWGSQLSSTHNNCPNILPGQISSLHNDIDCLRPPTNNRFVACQHSKAALILFLSGSP